MFCRVGENACPRRIQPSLALTEDKNDETHVSGPPRRWGGPEWIVATSVSQGCESAGPNPIQPSVALAEGEDAQNHFLGPPRR